MVLMPILVLLLFSLNSFGSRVNVSHFSEQGIKGWKPKIFKNETVYSVVEYEGSKYIQAMSQQSASGLTKELKIDLQVTPFLNWSWVIEQILQGNDEKTKSGDDFAARIYVIAKTGFGFWNTAALNYVWSNKSPVGDFWPNPFTAKAVMFCVEQGDAGLGKLRTYKRNVLDDFKQIFNKDIKEIQAIAIMTDTDNSQKNAKHPLPNS